MSALVIKNMFTKTDNNEIMKSKNIDFIDELAIGVLSTRTLDLDVFELLLFIYSYS